MSQTANLTVANLAQFNNGTNGYTRHWMRKLVCTDGIEFLNANGCAWFIDIVASHQLNPKVSAQEFQVWKLKPLTEKGFMAIAVCEDGNDNIVVRQKIEYTDFPFDRFPEGLKVYLEKGSLDGESVAWICMLPEER